MKFKKGQKVIIKFQYPIVGTYRGQQDNYTDTHMVEYRLHKFGNNGIFNMVYGDVLYPNTKFFRKLYGLER